MGNTTTAAPPVTAQRGQLDKTSTYKVDGKQFIVEPVFRKDGQETIGTILMRLMQGDGCQS